MEKKKTSLLSLFISFAKIGAFTFGGGYAMLPMLERECVNNHGWTTREELLDYFAIGQCTPGVIAVNTATFIGSKIAGILGGAAATLGVITPSIIIILIIAMLLNNFADNPHVINAFSGIRVAVAVLIINAIIRIIKQNVKDWTGIIIAALSFILVAALGISPVFAVIGAGLYGLVFGIVSNRNNKGKEDVK
ncbi:MAG: chromate transporter [Clostridia bacterium]|nr:chromate transporter [Clostridia bacterium]